MSAPYQLLPPLTPAEYAELRADIEANGIEQAVIVDDLGHIIDGHHRAQIADELGIECPVDVRVIDSEDAKRDLALRLNVHRRSLTRDQKRELLANLIKAAPERSDRQHASAVGVDHKTAGAVRSDLEGRGEIPHAGERTDTLGRQQPAKVTHRTTESETVEITSPGSRAPLQDSAPGVEQLSAEPGALDPIAAAKAEAAKSPHVLAHKAIDRYRDANQTVNAAGGIDVILTETRDYTAAQNWAKDLEDAIDIAETWLSAIRRQHLRSV